MLRDALDICLKTRKVKNIRTFDLYLGGDLMNQITTVHYLARELPNLLLVFMELVQTLHYLWRCLL